MNNDELARERRNQKRLERLGSNDPHCGICGEADDRTLELHHVAGRKHDETMVPLCRNCHRKVTDDQHDHPAFDPSADPVLASIGNFLLGLADMLSIIVTKLREFGLALIVRSTATEGEVA
jgi:hypothetical protein